VAIFQVHFGLLVALKEVEMGYLQIRCHSWCLSKNANALKALYKSYEALKCAIAVCIGKILHW